MSLPAQLETKPLQQIIYSDLSFTLSMEYFISKLVSSITPPGLRSPVVYKLLTANVFIVTLSKADRK